MQPVIPYLNFEGNCREAMTFYKQCLGGDLTVTTFGDVDPGAPAENKERAMHARLTSGPLVVMASDTMQGMPYHRGNSIWLNIPCDSDAEVDRLHDTLAAGGKSQMAPQDTFWNARFAMLTDRFGTNWMLNHEREAEK